MNKNDEILRLSENILGDLEHSSTVLESILLKCKKLARLKNDGEAMTWFTLELAGYEDKALPHGIKKEQASEIAHRSGRYTVVKGIKIPKGKDIKDLPPAQQELCRDQYYYYFQSIPHLEALIKTLEDDLKSLVPPSSFTPAVNRSSMGRTVYFPESSHETVQETYRDVFSAIQSKRDDIQNKIVTNKSIVARVRDAIYSYVYNINLVLKFGNITETIFEQARNLVNQNLVEKCPEVVEKLIASYDRLASNSQEEWAQALTSCRRVLKAFADSVYPAQKEPHIYGDREEIKVGDAEYKNRIWAYIDITAKGANRKKILQYKVEDLGNRIESINDLASKGVHADIEQLDVNMCVIDTYLLIGTLLQLKK